MLACWLVFGVGILLVGAAPKAGRLSRARVLILKLWVSCSSAHPQTDGNYSHQIDTSTVLLVFTLTDVDFKRLHILPPVCCSLFSLASAQRTFRSHFSRAKRPCATLKLMLKQLMKRLAICLSYVADLAIIQPRTNRLGFSSPFASPAYGSLSLACGYRRRA